MTHMLNLFARVSEEDLEETISRMRFFATQIVQKMVQNRELFELDYSFHNKNKKDHVKNEATGRDKRKR